MCDFEKTLLYATFFNELSKRFYVNVPFPSTAFQIQEAVDAFFNFLNEPQEVRCYIDFKISKNHRRGEVGFKHREANDGLYNDNKDLFQYHPAIMNEYSDFLEAHPVVKNFMAKAHAIWADVYYVTRKILEIFEPHYPGIIKRIYDTEKPHILLRFLKYEWSSSGKYLAKPHYDAGSFTLAISESCQGLRIGSCPDNLQIVDHTSEHALFMLSSNFKKLIFHDDLHAGWHDVIQLDEQKIGKPYARWAVVAFIEAHDVDALPRSETHKWAIVN